MSASGDAYRIKCPICHAAAGLVCRDANGHPRKKVHEKRGTMVTALYMRRAFMNGRVDHLMARAQRRLPLGGHSLLADLD